jgi:membrane protein implicated in regulation of membrane protease activity
MAANRAAFRVAAALLALPALFFTYYTLRLIYINLAVPAAAQHRQWGMYIGFFAFPAAAIVFLWLSAFCWRRSKRNRAARRP